MPEAESILLLGLGNLLLADDGAGVAALHRLRREVRLPERVLALDGGTLGLALLPHVERAQHLILLDAVAAPAPAGTVVRLEGEQVPPAVATRLSPHQLGVSELLLGARSLGCYPSSVVLLGIVPRRIGLGVERSPDVRAGLPRLILAALEELRSLGVEPGAMSAPEGEAQESHVGRIFGI